MGRRGVAMVGGLAAVAAGSLWVVKGAVILATGWQPALVFEPGTGLVPVALIGLRACIDDDGRAARAGGRLVWCSAGLALMVVAASQLPGHSDEVLGALAGLCGLVSVAALVVLGRAVRTAGALGDRWSTAPLVLGVAPAGRHGRRRPPRGDQRAPPRGTACRHGHGPCRDRGGHTEDA